ncbi:MAG: hypothetical protein, partial [Olavius algarvensis Gamma 1 endosymbiont]
RHRRRQRHPTPRRTPGLAPGHEGQAMGRSGWSRSAGPRLRLQRAQKTT